MNIQFGKRSSTLMGKIFKYFILIIILMLLLNLYSIYGFKDFYRSFYSMYGQLIKTHGITLEMDGLEQEVENYIHSGSKDYIDKYEKKLEKLHTELNGLKQASNGEVYYNYKDIQNMVITFDEKSKNIFEKYKKGTSPIYMNQYISELKRLNGYIDNGVKEVHFKKLIEIQGYYYNFFKSMVSKESVIYIVTAFITLMCFIIAYKFSMQISVPIHKLVLNLKKVANGEFDSELIYDDKKSDEINILINSFNVMKTQISGLINEIRVKANVENELKEQRINNLEMVNLLNQSELKFLQSQINPHFLFNTMNTISALAEIEEAHETKKILDSMAGILRYNLRKINEYVTLREEYQIIVNYINIQRARFGDRISYEVDVDEAAMEYKIPSMIIQPFIENAVLHGLEPKEGRGILGLKICVDNNNIYISIHDNGLGMSHRKAQSFFTTSKIIEEDMKDCIGVTNVIRRLQITYGKNVVEIDSEINVGTNIKIEIPKSTA